MRSIIFIGLLGAGARARFNQEQGNGAIAAIGALSDLGQPGQAATLSGGSIKFLLAAANPCDKLKQADLIVSQLGTSDAAIAAARGLVAAEQNFNPFVVSVPSVCSDASLPATAELRGVVPLVDPAVAGSDVENANAEASKTSPFAADGLSVAQVMANQGFTNFTAVALDGTKTSGDSTAGSGAGNDGAAGGSVSASADASPAAPTALPATAGGACFSNSTVKTTMITVTVSATAAADAAATDAADTQTGGKKGNNSNNDNNGNNDNNTGNTGSGSGAVQNDVTGSFSGFVASSIAGLDFGTCVPTMKFEAGLNGRKETEFTFQAIDPVVNKGQQEALNPNIITNRIKDQLGNVCGANDAAKAAAVDAQAQILALGTRDQTTADQWNTLLGFAGADTNPDNAPKAGLVGHT